MFFILKRILLLLIVSVFSFSSYGNEGNKCAKVFDTELEASNVKSANQKIGDFLTLNTRVKSVLSAEGLILMGDLLQRTEQDVLDIPGIGKVSLLLIKDELALKGLALGMRLPEDWNQSTQTGTPTDADQNASAEQIAETGKPADADQTDTPAEANQTANAESTAQTGTPTDADQNASAEQIAETGTPTDADQTAHAESTTQTETPADATTESTPGRLGTLATRFGRGLANARRLVTDQETRQAAATAAGQLVTDQAVRRAAVTAAIDAGRGTLADARQGTAQTEADATAESTSGRLRTLATRAGEGLTVVGQVAKAAANAANSTLADARSTADADQTTQADKPTDTTQTAQTDKPADVEPTAQPEADQTAQTETPPDATAESTSGGLRTLATRTGRGIATHLVTGDIRTAATRFGRRGLATARRLAHRQTVTADARQSTADAGQTSSAESTAQTGTPTDADQTSSAESTAQTGTPTDADQNANAEQTAETGKPADTDQTANAEQTAETGKPADADQTANAEQTAETGKPADADQTDKPAEPAVAEGHNTTADFIGDTHSLYVNPNQRNAQTDTPPDATTESTPGRLRTLATRAGSGLATARRLATRQGMTAAINAGRYTLNAETDATAESTPGGLRARVSRGLTVTRLVATAAASAARSNIMSFREAQTFVQDQNISTREEYMGNRRTTQTDTPADTTNTEQTAQTDTPPDATTESTPGILRTLAARAGSGLANAGRLVTDQEARQAVTAAINAGRSTLADARQGTAQTEADATAESTPGGLRARVSRGLTVTGRVATAAASAARDTLANAREKNTADADQTTQADKPTDTAQTAQTDKPADIEPTAQPEADQTTQAAEPAQTDTPAEAAEPTQAQYVRGFWSDMYRPADQARPAETEQTDKPAETDKPADTAQTGNIDAPQISFEESQALVRDIDAPQISLQEAHDLVQGQDIRNHEEYGNRRTSETDKPADAEPTAQPEADKKPNRLARAAVTTGVRMGSVLLTPIWHWPLRQKERSRILNKTGNRPYDVKEEYQGQAGHIRYANEFYGGDMAKARDSVLAVLNEFERNLLNW